MHFASSLVGCRCLPRAHAACTRLIESLSAAADSLHLARTQAGGSGPNHGPELAGAGLEDPEGFRSMVLAARRLLNGGGTDADRALLNGTGVAGGADKGSTVIPSPLRGSGSAIARVGGGGGITGDAKVIALLERISSTLERMEAKQGALR